MHTIIIDTLLFSEVSDYIHAVGGRVVDYSKAIICDGKEFVRVYFTNVAKDSVKEFYHNILCH